MPTLRSTLRLLSTVALLAIAAPIQAQSFKVIANSDVVESELPSDVIARIFLKQSPKFPSGMPARPVDLKKDSSVRARFSTEVVGRPVAAVETYWQQQIFAGKEVPPAAKASDEEVLAFVRSTPGAIGYVSAGASTAGVKVIAVK